MNYEEFITEASNYVCTSGGDGVEYQEYLKAHNAARLISSKDTKLALKNVSTTTIH